MIKEFSNVRNPMFGAFILWNFIKGYYLVDDKNAPLELTYIVLPMVMKQDVAQTIKGTRIGSGMRVFSGKFMDSKSSKNDMLAILQKDIKRMRELSCTSFAEGVRAGLFSVDPNDFTVFPLDLKNTLMNQRK